MYVRLYVSTKVSRHLYSWKALVPALILSSEESLALCLPGTRVKEESEFSAKAHIQILVVFLIVAFGFFFQPG